MEYLNCAVHQERPRLKTGWCDVNESLQRWQFFLYLYFYILYLRWLWIPDCPLRSWKARSRKETGTGQLSSQVDCFAEDYTCSGSVGVDSDKTYAALRGKGRIKLEGSDLCLSVGSKRTEGRAGPYFRRDLLLSSCDMDQKTLVWRLVI